jgi:hypothetical protein
MRGLMRAEAATLLKELVSQRSLLKKRLQALQKRLQRDSDEMLLSDLAGVRDELTSVRRGLARLSISEQSTLKLKNEWHDWTRHKDLSGEIDHALREERLEMLASELSLRGYAPSIVLQDANVIESPRNADDREFTEEESEGEGNADSAIAHDVAEDVLMSELGDDIEQTDWSEAGDYWERLIAGCHPKHTDHAQLARLLKAFRDVQGERRRQDCEHHVERYRLSAFDAW